MVTFTNKMAATDFFPPNPEDGELWLPSFIIHEISTTNAAVLPSHQPAATTTFEICFGSFGAKPITATTNSGRAANNDNKHKLAPAPITPTTTTPQGVVERKKRTDLGEKYGGTGVFLPRLTDIVAGAGAGGGRRGGDGAKKTEETSRGTGVFLNHQVSVTFQKKDNSGKEEKTLGSNNKMKCCAINKEDIFGKQENSQHPSGICLPNDWIY
ncbi:uncharacterized protein LOC102628267 isoform X2 [Citrus sinensis]|uniref:uncharacterized protein LOC102628267 isoform X2 n=1 Tax=Citrus sinensis TaxID=2711 RepID=UPI000D6234E1|nr:uncharacterized protein LOC102628267 isoform X2 [Citrus sinensis]